MFAQAEKKLRVLELVNVRWWNACAEYGVHLALGLHRRGHRVIVVGGENSLALREAQRLGLPVRPTKMESHHPATFLSSLLALVRLVRRERIQVINAHRAEGHLCAALASLLLREKVVVVRTRGDVRSPKGHWLNRILHHRLTDAIVLPSKAMRKPVSEALGLSANKLCLIPPGVDLRRFANLRSKEEWRKTLGWTDQGTVVGIVGRYSPVKGHRVFLKAAHLVLKANPQTTFVIVGHEAQIKTADLQGLARRLGFADRVRFTGFVPDVTPYIGAFDVAVVASLGSEVICRVTLEYMAAAKPVVGTTVNAIPEIVVHGSTGLLVPPGNPGAMSEAILSLAQNPQKARALGQAGRRRVEEEFTIDHLVQRTEALYWQVIEARHGGASKSPTVSLTEQGS